MNGELVSTPSSHRSGASTPTGAASNANNAASTPRRRATTQSKPHKPTPVQSQSQSQEEQIPWYVADNDSSICYCFSRFISFPPPWKDCRDAIDAMQAGTFLLKCGRIGNPHFR